LAFLAKADLFIVWREKNLSTVTSLACCSCKNYILVVLYATENSQASLLYGAYLQNDPIYP